MSGTTFRSARILTRRVVGRVMRALPAPRPILMPSGVAAAERVPGAVALSNRLAFRLQNSRFAGSDPGETLANLLHLEAEPTLVRLVHVNDGPEPWTLHGAAIAPTAEVGDGFTPVNEAGEPDDTLWRPMTYNAGGGDSSPLDRREGEARALEIPGNPFDNGRPVHALSDWVPLRALPRRDGGTGFLLLVRSFSHGSIRYAACMGQPDPAIGRLHRGFRAEGDRTEAGRSHGFVADDKVFAAHGLQFIGPTAGATVMGIGDSIMNSSCTQGEMSGYGIRACVAVSRPDLPVSYVNEGFPGRNSLGYATSGAWGIETFRPQITLIQPWTQNEPWTPAQADLSFARAMALVDLTRRHGGVPVLTTAAPTMGEHPESEPIRQNTNERIRAAAQGGYRLLDLDALWGTGSVPNRYRLPFDAGDGAHPTNQACAVAGEALVPILKDILGQA